MAPPARCLLTVEPIAREPSTRWSGSEARRWSAWTWTPALSATGCREGAARWDGPAHGGRRPAVHPQHDHRAFGRASGSGSEPGWIVAGAKLPRAARPCADVGVKLDRVVAAQLVADGVRVGHATGTVVLHAGGWRQLPLQRVSDHADRRAAPPAVAGGPPVVDTVDLGRRGPAWSPGGTGIDRCPPSSFPAPSSARGAWEVTGAGAMGIGPSGRTRRPRRRARGQRFPPAPV